MSVKKRDDKQVESIKKIRNEVMNGLHNCLKELKAEGIKCSIEQASDGNSAIVGTYKNEPFCVYYLKMVMSNGEYASIVMTRWKGKDHRIKKPISVLTGG
jgi:hypothetical protein